MPTPDNAPANSEGDDTTGAEPVETPAGTFIPPAPSNNDDGDDDAAGLRDAGKRALETERLRAKNAEKQAREALKRLKELEDRDLTEAEKWKRQAEEGSQKLEAATRKARDVNLRSALNDLGFNGSRAKAAARLLDGVDFDDDDEPTNLKAALKAAEREYGDLVKPTPAAPSTGFDGGARESSPAQDFNSAIRRAAGRT
jgi:hypothetical protein